MSPWTILAAVLLLGAAAGAGYYEGSNHTAAVYKAQIATIQKTDAQALAASVQKARAQEQAAEQAQAAAQATYEKDKADAKAQYDHDVAALRAGTLKLRSEWSCTPQLAAAVQSAAASGPSADAKAEQRDKDASDLVRISADADAQIRALQAIVSSDRQ
jgi:hypothetical protein